MFQKNDLGRKKGRHVVPKNGAKSTEWRKPELLAWSSAAEPKPKTTENGGYTKVTPKKAKEESKVRFHPGAIVISSKVNRSYAEMLKKVKIDPNLKDLGGNANKMPDRRSHV